MSQWTLLLSIYYNIYDIKIINYDLFLFVWLTIVQILHTT